MSAWLWFAQEIDVNARPPRLGDLEVVPPRLRPFGVDISALPDLTFGLNIGLVNVAEALGRRLVTPRGGLFYDPTYGTDLRAYLNLRDTTASRYELEVVSAREAEKDERILEADAETLTWGENAIRLELNATLDTGPYEFVLDIDRLNVTLFSRLTP